MFSNNRVESFDADRIPELEHSVDENPRVKQLASRSRSGIGENGELLPNGRCVGVRDALFEAALHRFSIDSILLGRFVRVRRRDRILELGAGCGVISVMIAALWLPREVVAVEIQSDLAAIAERNAALNQLDSIRVINADLRSRRIDKLAPASFDM